MQTFFTTGSENLGAAAKEAGIPVITCEEILTASGKIGNFKSNFSLYALKRNFFLHGKRSFLRS